MMIGGVGVPAPDGEIRHVVTGYGASMDTDQGRYRSGFAGMLTQRRVFGKLGTMDPRQLSVEDIEADERFRTLSRQAAELLDERDYGLSAANTMCWRGQTRWLLAVHEIINRPWEPLPGYSSAYRQQQLVDVFLQSAQ